eukprot:scaffold365798_cov41-Prasinocladus_malaysianus.AAC.1
MALVSSHPVCMADLEKQRPPYVHIFGQALRAHACLACQQYLLAWPCCDPITAYAFIVDAVALYALILYSL